jgi:signal transduction histidine kinase
MKRWPIRGRLTAAYALAMLVVLAAAGVFVYLRVQAELSESITASLRSRSGAVAARVKASGPGRALGEDSSEPEESFAQILSPSGRVLASTGGAKQSVLGPRTLRRAASTPTVFETVVGGIEGTARVLARPASLGPDSPIVAVGESLEDRDETLAGLLAALVGGGLIAVAAASLVGYGLAAAGLAPVEAMRLRAREVSLAQDEALPLPAADDEIRRLGVTLNEMLARLRAAYEREHRFVSDASHELRTPLAVLKAEIEAALRGGPHRAEVHESLTAALEECDHLTHLAEDLLVLARAGEGGLSVHAEEMSAAQFLAEVKERFAYRAEEQSRQIRVDAEEELRFSADSLRTRQALANLVDNALRHGEGEITLSARRSEEGDGVELAVECAKNRR